MNSAPSGGESRVFIAPALLGGRGLFSSTPCAPQQLLIAENALVAYANPHVTYPSGLYCGHCFRFVGDFDSHASQLNSLIDRPPLSQVSNSLFESLLMDWFSSTFCLIIKLYNSKRYLD